MDKSEYRRLHEKEVNEFRLYTGENGGYNSDKHKKASDRLIRINYQNKNIRLIFGGLVVSLVGFAISSSLVLCGYYIGRNYGREEVNNEIERMQKEKKIMILNKKEIEKMNKDLEEVIDNERARYFIKGMSPTK